ncbi:27466_t:CDS:2 [Gigaspora margarita]|nr:27466_t:CDS:2 [Gigaspora margarita]
MDHYTVNRVGSTSNEENIEVAITVETVSIKNANPEDISEPEILIPYTSGNSKVENLIENILESNTSNESSIINITSGNTLINRTSTIIPCESRETLDKNNIGNIEGKKDKSG